MTDRRLAAIALTVTVAVLVGYGAWTITVEREPAPAPPVPGRPLGDPDDTVLTREQVAEHQTRDDCWTIVGDEVFDLTSFIGSHPGGAAIEEACGIDATTLFEDREREDGSEVGSGEDHSSEAEDRLEELQIGVLPDE